MKYQLMVSYDCGMTYATEDETDDVMDFAERCKELDDGSFRWTIADEHGNDIAEPQFVCRIFRTIVAENAKATRPFYARGGAPG